MAAYSSLAHDGTNNTLLFAERYHLLTVARADQGLDDAGPVNITSGVTGEMELVKVE